MATENEKKDFDDLGIDKLVLVPDAGHDAPPEVSSILGAVYNSSRLEWANNNPMNVENSDNKISSARMAWNAVKQAGWVNTEKNGWVNERDLVQDGKFETYAESDNFTLENREIFATGTHNGISYTEKDLDDMVQAFKDTQKAIRPRIKLGHDVSKWKDGLPALGWATDLKRVGGKLVASFAQVPKILKDSIDSGRYKRVSSEVYHNLKLNGQTYRRALAAVAFLGTDLPAVKNLADLDAYLTQDPSDAGTFDSVCTYTMDNEEYEYKDNTKDDLEEDMSDKDLKELKDKNADLEAKVKKFEEDESKRLKTQHETDIKSFCEDSVKAGTMTPAQRDILTKDTGVHCYSQDAGFSFTIETIKSFVEASGKLDKDEHGHDDKNSDKKKDFKDINDELHQKTLTYIAEHKDATYADAQLQVIYTDEDLARRIEKDAKSEEE